MRHSPSARPARNRAGGSRRARPDRTDRPGAGAPPTRGGPRRAATATGAAGRTPAVPFVARMAPRNREEIKGGSGGKRPFPPSPRARRRGPMQDAAGAPATATVPVGGTLDISPAGDVAGDRCRPAPAGLVVAQILDGDFARGRYTSGQHRAIGDVQYPVVGEAGESRGEHRGLTTIGGLGLPDGRPRTSCREQAILERSGRGSHDPAKARRGVG